MRRHRAVPSASPQGTATRRWTAAQAGFQREATLDDAEWVVIVDALNSELHQRH